MNIEEYLNNFFKGTKNPSLDAMRYFMTQYNNFISSMKFIHVAGTNGKGSVVEMISSILQEEGYKVGKFISPHLIKYNERISINGNQITNKEMENLIEELKPKIDKYNLNNNVKITLFELETTMALLYFYRNNVDFVVLETGLGGLYDCTNIIQNTIVSIITSIGYDHMHILGNSLEEIAYQKAGIIKENSNTVFFSQTESVNNVIESVCNEKKNKPHKITKKSIENYRFDDIYQYFDYENMKNIKINLKGKKQIENASLCIECAKIINDLGYNISEKSIRHGLENVVHKGRMECICEQPKIIFDGAHNEPAIVNLQDMIDMYYKNYKRTYVISILKRKDYYSMVKRILEDKDATFIFTSGIDEERYTSGKELCEIAKRYKKDNVFEENLGEALTRIINSKENKNEVTFIIGSFYTYGMVVNKIKEIDNDRSKECKL